MDGQDLSVSEACTLLGISAEALRKRIERGHLTPRSGIGKAARFAASDLERLRRGDGRRGRTADGQNADADRRLSVPSEAEVASLRAELASARETAARSDAERDRLNAALERAQGALSQALGALADERQRSRQLEETQARLIQALPAPAATQDDAEQAPGSPGTGAAGEKATEGDPGAEGGTETRPATRPGIWSRIWQALRD